MNLSLSPQTASMSHDRDRTSFVPRHEGRNVLPNAPLFSTLLRFAKRNPPRPAVRDVNLEIERTYAQLLTDVLALRHSVQLRLSPASVASLRHGGEVYIGLLAPGGYEYTVAFLAILALGAVVVPMSTAVPVEEASYFVRKSRAVAILTSSSCETIGELLEQSFNKATKGHAHIVSIPIATGFSTSNTLQESIVISSNLHLDENGAGVLIFTSGTTGPPKGAVMRRSFVYDCALSVADHYRLTESDVILHVLPVHHATGIGINLFPFLVSGACVEFRSGSFDSAWMWERWREGGLTFFSGVPTIYMRMMRFYEEVIAVLPSPQKEEYIGAARCFRGLLCGSSALPRPVQQFWTRVLDGRIILTRYGATEFGTPFMVPLDNKMVPEGSVGEVVPGLDVKLSGGDEGEVLLKNPYMFSRYISDNEATSKAHNEEGYFKTGDIARREGSYYFIVGRAAIDIIKSGGYKISALDIEREILGLPYISEVMVVGVSDDEFGQRVAAAVTLKKSRNGDGHRENLSIDDLRRDLKEKLTGYKMPTLLRVIDGELPKNVSGKVLKKKLGPELFPLNYSMIPEVQKWSRKRPLATARL